MLLGGTLAAVRDRLLADGYEPAAELVADLVELADEFVSQPR